MSMFYYFPLEPYQERYTEYLSSHNGFWETWLRNSRYPFKSIRGEGASQHISTGQVLDAGQRCSWALRQTEQFVQMIQKGEVHDGDVVYLEDFWHPGFMAFPYCRDLYKIDFKIYVYCWAQSVDPYDFTRSMALWMRHFEQGIGKVVNGIIVCAKELKQMLVTAQIAPVEKIMVCGLPFYSQRFLELYPESQKESPRKKEVIFASRWDREKNPWVFIDLMETVIQKRPDITFRVCSGAEEIRSNDGWLVQLARKTLENYPQNFFFSTNLTKSEYYKYLRSAKVIFNCASQDFVSWTLLEGTISGCQPLYPCYLTFPEALCYRSENLYVPFNVKDAANKLIHLIDGLELEIDGEYQRAILRRHENAFRDIVNWIDCLQMPSAQAAPLEAAALSQVIKAQTGMVKALQDLLSDCQNVEKSS